MKVIIALFLAACIFYSALTVAAGSNCKKAREKAINKLEREGENRSVWKYVPNCHPADETRWAPEQCQVHRTKGAKQCRCVNFEGTPLNRYSTGRDEICSPRKCDEAEVMSRFEQEMREKQAEDQGVILIVDAYYFPDCQEINTKRWNSRQCIRGMVNSCWFVNVKTGKRLPNSDQKQLRPYFEEIPE